MSRIPGIDEGRAGLSTRIIFWFARRKLGKVPQGMKIRALWPKLLGLTARFDMLMAKPGTVPDKLKELAQLKVAAMVGCPF